MSSLLDTSVAANPSVAGPSRPAPEGPCRVPCRRPKSGLRIGPLGLRRSRDPQGNREAVIDPRLQKGAGSFGVLSSEFEVHAVNTVGVARPARLREPLRRAREVSNLSQLSRALALAFAEATAELAEAPSARRRPPPREKRATLDGSSGRRLSVSVRALNFELLASNFELPPRSGGVARPGGLEPPTLGLEGEIVEVDLA